MASKKARLSESLIEFRKAEESLKCYSISKKYMIEKKKNRKKSGFLLSTRITYG